MEVKSNRKNVVTRITYFIIITISLFLFNTHTVASAIILHGNQIITKPTTYHDVSLDLTDGRFTVNTGGSLTIRNSIVNITISPTNPYFVLLNSGILTLNNSTVRVNVSGIAQTPDVKSLYQLISVVQGNVNITGNNLTIDTPFAASFLTTQNNATNGFIISNNTMSSFHGGIFLNNSNGATVSDNTFLNVSFSNIYNNGDMNKFSGNIFQFPGNLKKGNAFDIVNSDGVTISNNVITNSSNYGISITGAHNLFIENNKITDGKYYGIIINTPTMGEIRKNKYLSNLMSTNTKRLLSNNNIVISSNYFSQNRFGLTAGEVENLIVTNNVFIQRFSDTSIRQYWTNNDNLLPSVENLTWIHNMYKEAFTQDNEGDNKPSLKFVEFPMYGGVFIN